MGSPIFRTWEGFLKNAGCYVCILKTPILWEQDIIKVLVMIKTKRDGDKNLSLLCRIVSIGHHRRKRWNIF